jgi:hypothetical protein
MDERHVMNVAVYCSHFWPPADCRVDPSLDAESLGSPGLRMPLGAVTKVEQDVALVMAERRYDPLRYLKK